MNKELLQILLIIASINERVHVHARVANLIVFLQYAYKQTLEAVFNE